jgi:hypothetical protein
MERLRPNHCQSAFLLLMATCLCGCQNPQMAATNPFLAPDRVPPPATRVIAPGTAQPYYPGDPLPAAQNVPSAGAPVAQAQTQLITQTTPVASGQPLAFNNERPVAIPADTENLRFALPAPPATQPLATPEPAAASVAAAPAAPVTPALYNQPGTQPAATNQTGESAPSGPWRDPQIPTSASTVMPAQFVQPQPLQPSAPVAAKPQAATASPAMPVELRAVPSPTAAPFQPAVVPPPRMRFPSLMSPSTWFTPPAPAANQQLIGYMVPGPNGTMQMVTVQQLGPTAAGAVEQSTSVASADGFRPRSSAR